MSTLLGRVGIFVQMFLALFVCTIFLGTIAGLIYSGRSIEASVKDILLILIGVLASSFKDVVGYYFGSSLGSSKKDEAKP